MLTTRRGYATLPAMSPNKEDREFFGTLRRWIVSISVLVSISLVVYFSVYLVDFYLVGNRSAELGPLTLFTNLTPAEAASIIDGMPEVLVAILAIIITVGFIVVELAATRYTARITEMFFKDRVNVLFILFYTIAAIYCFWVNHSIRTGSGVSEAHYFVPVVGVLLNSFFVTVALLLMAPYFNYVFYFLQPENIVDRLEKQTIDRAIRSLRSPERRDIVDGQLHVLNDIEQLTDIGVNTVENKDQIIASRVVGAFKDLCVRYLSCKKDSSGTWHEISEEMRGNLDFSALTTERIETMSSRRIWFEYKVLRQYQMIFGEALNRMRDIDYLIAISTREIGEAAIGEGDTEVQRLTVKFFNTYMRASLNVRDHRTAYNLLNQYRVFLESMIRAGLVDLSVETAYHFKYYACLARDMGIDFITECAAYDVGRAVEAAEDLASPVADELLGILLEIDKGRETVTSGGTLRGVLKAQIKLAAYFLARESIEKAQRIYLAMKTESADRLLSVVEELSRVTSADFREITDRGEDFDYLEPDRRAQLEVFSRWISAA